MFKATLHDENVLLSELSLGNEKAFGTLYNNYEQPLYNFLVKYTKSPELTKDLSQEIFIKIWENRTQLSQMKSFSAYLFIVARNHALNFMKKSSQVDAAVGEIIRHYEALRSGVDDRMVSDEYSQWLQNVLDSMSPQMRSVFRLCREHGKTYDEVAALLGISRNTVKNTWCVH